MVHRDKDFANPPLGLLDVKWDSLKINLLVEKNNHEVKDTCYRDTTKDNLTQLYKNKCAICERDRGTELQVDHYRPKKVRNNKTDPIYNQPGYYWLAYTWSNLIPLCSKCNGNKSNKFPLKGWIEINRISDHLNINGLNPFIPYDLNWLQTKEQPLMLNPEIETIPARHFSFRSDGSIKGKTDEGRETINICKLNRKDLKRERIKIRQNFVNSIKSSLDDYSRNLDKSELNGALKSVFKTMKVNCHIDSPHSLYHFYLYLYFDYFIDSKLPANLKGIASKYFIDFKKL